VTSDPELMVEWRKYNRLLFGNSLRNDVILYWDSLSEEEADGEINDEIIPGKFVIRIKAALAGWKNQWRIALIHEMAHLHIWPYQRHGEQWDREIVRLCKYKSFRKLI
jgi:hypothetical protein